MSKEILETMNKIYIDYLRKQLKRKDISKYRKVYILAELKRCEDGY